MLTFYALLQAYLALEERLRRVNGGLVAIRKLMVSLRQAFYRVYSHSVCFTCVRVFSFLFLVTVVVSDIHTRA
jgi:hypothetical protein